MRLVESEPFSVIRTRESDAIKVVVRLTPVTTQGPATWVFLAVRISSRR